MARYLVLLALFAALAVALAACEKPGASHTTSPSALALLGTADGVVAFAPLDPPPAALPPPDGWEFDIGNARFSELEDGTAAIQVVGNVRTRPGASAELWLARDGVSVARWSGGLTRAYSGTLCFQFQLAAGGEVVPLGAGSYTLTLVFRDHTSAAVLGALVMPVVGRVPGATGGPPRPGSDVMRQLLGCPRSVI